MPRLRQSVAKPLPRRSGFVPRPARAVLVVDKAVMGQVSIQALQFLPVRNILPMFHTDSLINYLIN